MMLRKNKKEIKKREQREEESLDTERDRARKKIKKRTRRSVFGIVLIVIVFGGFCVMIVGNLIKMADEEDVVSVVEEKIEPTAPITDENGAGQISERTKEFIGQLEGDLKEFDLKLARAALPIGKMREIDVNLEGLAPYFKVNIDRGAGVSAEDIARMVKYLRNNNLLEGVTYVDVRVEGKAFYK